MKHLRYDRIMLYVFAAFWINSLFSEIEMHKNTMSIIVIIWLAAVCIIDEIRKLNVPQQTTGEKK